MKILLIEGDATTLEVMRSYLEFYIPDLTLLATTQGMEGIRICRHTSPDLVIIDIHLQDSDGYQVLSAIRETSDVPVIAIYSAEDEEAMSRILKSGADEILARHFNASDLLMCIASSLEKRGIAPAFRFDLPH